MENDNLKPFILITDDSSLNRLILKNLLEDEYQILEAEDGLKAVEILNKYKTQIAIVLLDLMMPNLDGFGVLSILKTKDYASDIPIIMISTEDSSNFMVKAFDLGVTDCIQRPFISSVIKKKIANMIRLFSRQKEFKEEIIEQEKENEKIANMMSVILSQIVGYRNNESSLHLLHVEQLTSFLLEELENISDYKFTEKEKKSIAIASGMHDIGKIGIDESILNKPGKLTKEEFEKMKEHTLIGAEMINQVEAYKDEQFVKYIYDICRWHHEKWNGKGYPDGLKGNEIPIWAQVVSLADVYDALVSKRVYKGPYTHDEAIQMIQNKECGEFNPILLECLGNVKEKIKAVYILEETKR